MNIHLLYLYIIYSMAEAGSREIAEVQYLAGIIILSMTQPHEFDIPLHCIWLQRVQVWRYTNYLFIIQDKFSSEAMLLESPLLLPQAELVRLYYCQSLDNLPPPW